MRLFFGGDVMQHMPQVDAVRRGDGFDYEPVFRTLAPRIRAADLAVVNLETTLTRRSRYTGYPLFRSAPRRWPTPCATQAWMSPCWPTTTAATTAPKASARASRSWTAAEYATRARSRTALITTKITRFTSRIAAYGWRSSIITYGTNGMPVPEGTVVNLIDTVRMAADLAAARASGVDFIVACVHWGDEYQRRENAAQRSLAAFLRRHGTDVVVGSHPHVIQPWVADSSHVVLYSLGNLVSGQRRRYTDGGLVATVEAVRHPEGRMTYRLETTPVWVSVPGYRILTPEAADTMTLPAAYGIFRADLDALPGNGL